MYKNEAAFSKAFVTKAREIGCFVQRIESPETGCGIPDVMIASDKGPVFVELKNMPYITGQNWPLKVQWRKGQQAWALNYFKATKKCTVTVVALYKSYIVIPMVKHFISNVVERDDAWYIASLHDLIKRIK